MSEDSKMAGKQLLAIWWNMNYVRANPSTELNKSDLFLEKRRQWDVQVASLVTETVLYL